MIDGLELFREVCVAANPAAAIAGLSDPEIEALDDALRGLPDQGFPGVAAAQVTADLARRWRIERAAERSRS